MLQALFNPISRIDCGWVRDDDSALFAIFPVDSEVFCNFCVV